MPWEMWNCMIIQMFVGVYGEHSSYMSSTGMHHYSEMSGKFCSLALAEYQEPDEVERFL